MTTCILQKLQCIKIYELHNKYPWSFGQWNHWPKKSLKLVQLYKKKKIKIDGTTKTITKSKYESLVNLYFPKSWPRASNVWLQHIPQQQQTPDVMIDPIIFFFIWNTTKWKVSFLDFYKMKITEFETNFIILCEHYKWFLKKLKLIGF